MAYSGPNYAKLFGKFIGQLRHTNPTLYRELSSALQKITHWRHTPIPGIATESKVYATHELLLKYLKEKGDEQWQ